MKTLIHFLKRSHMKNCGYFLPSKCIERLLYCVDQNFYTQIVPFFHEMVIVRVHSENKIIQNFVDNFFFKREEKQCVPCYVFD